MIRLPITVNSAFRGYSWSRIPVGISETSLDTMLKTAAEVRGDFPEPNRLDRGIVMLGGIAAAFSLQTAAGWDSEGRDSEYAAFTLFDPNGAASIDFAALLDHPFFVTPSREASRGEITTIDYEGGVSAEPPITAAGNLLCRQRFDGFPASAAGKFLATYHTRSAKWLFRLSDDAARPSFTVTCAPWRMEK